MEIKLRSASRTLIILALVVFVQKTWAQNTEDIVLIPRPDHLLVRSGDYQIPDTLTLIFDEQFKDEVALLTDYLTDYGLSVRRGASQKSAIKLVFQKEIGKSGYQLDLNENAIVLQASSREGILYGIQTLRQLFLFALEGEGKIPCLEIKDAPNFDYRGMHLDVSRHFMPVDFVKKYIDYLALFKMNYFHWHLTDDQGWRIEIKQYPKLTEVGAVRKETLIGQGGRKPFNYDGQAHGGYYTQQEIREIINFAERRGVTVIPEIELPGHSRAAIAAYPFLGCTGDSIDVWTRWGVSPYIYNIDDTTFRFLEAVLTEVAELFPSEYIHIGGDEAVKNQWRSSEKIQQQMKTLGIEDEEALQAWFIERIAAFLASKGKKIIGWDEILHGGAPDDAVIMYWRSWKQDPNPAIEAVCNGHKVILTPNSISYFDHYQSRDENEPLAIGGYNPVDSVYLKSYLPDGFPQDKMDLVWGVQANLWTEYIPDPKHAEYMLFPRMPALAEVLWTDQHRQNLRDFKRRFAAFQKFMDSHEIHYSKHFLPQKNE